MYLTTFATTFRLLKVRDSRIDFQTVVGVWSSHGGAVDKLVRTFSEKGTPRDETNCRQRLTYVRKENEAVAPIERLEPVIRPTCPRGTRWVEPFIIFSVLSSSLS